MTTRWWAFGVWAVVAVSACLSLMFPTIYGIALHGLGDDTKFGAAGLVMAILGGATVPLIHGADGHKLSKRHGAVSVLEFAEQGFLPEAVCNYLLRLGWAHGDLEVISREEAIRLGYLSGDEFDRLVRPERMTRPG